MTDPIQLTVSGPLAQAIVMAKCRELGLVYSVGDVWETDKRWDPEEILFRETSFHSGTFVVGLDDGMLVSLFFGRSTSISVSIYGRSTQRVSEKLEALREILTPVPVSEDQIVGVTFWTHTRNGASEVTRKLTVPAWAEVAGNYSPSSVGRLEEMIRLTEPVGGRLYLWHGPPGTGKTYALRALAWEWRRWADLHYLVEPESFFGANPADLMEIAMPDDDDEDPEEDYRTPRQRARRIAMKKRWRLLVMEDAGEMITKDAKINVGQSLSRLLNLVDGLIGQGLRVMVLLTTNEPVGQLHPALSRPGRTGMEIRFDALSPSQANAWLQRHESGIRVTEAQTLAELYGLLGAWHGRDKERPVGFRPRPRSSSLERLPDKQEAGVEEHPASHVGPLG